jgi:hypothetical protein
VAEGSRAFRLHGTTVTADIERGEDGRLFVRRISQASRRPGDAPVVLLESALSFCDADRAGTFAGEARTQLDHIVADSNSYLELWRKYKELEREVKIEEALELGSFPYDRCNWKPDLEGGVVAEFHLREDTPNLRQQLRALQGAREISLEAGTEVPPELRRRPDEGGADSPPEAEAETAPRHGRRRGPRVKETPRFSGRADPKGVIPEQYLIRLKPRDVGRRGPRPPERGVLYPSLFADKISRARRDRAFDQVRSASGPMPQLGLIVEGQLDLLPTARWPGIDPLALGVVGRLTEVQKEALCIALNTPDIALIQGPPGTGKTTVIAALMQCLSALADPSTGLRGLVLLSSFQHDALENAASKGLVKGVPVMKIGGRSGKAATAADKVARQWARERIDHLTPRRKETPAQQAYREVQQRVRAYVLAPGTRHQTAGLLREVLELVKAPDRASADLIPLPLRERLSRCLETLGPDAPPDGDHAADREVEARRAVRALRSDPAAFADDGPARALQAAVALRRADRRDLLDDPTRDLLHRAGEWAEGEPPFLTELAALRERLLAALTPESLPATADLPQLQVQQLLEDVLKALRDRTRQTAEGPAAILDEYLHDLENDPQAVHEALVHYTPVLASTCPQAASKEVARVKGGDLIYDTVIVDEAARANPLDLFIPMTMARRRVILVGDHRQLPHILEPKLQKQIDESDDQKTQDSLARSLFERLFSSLSERQKVDKIPRTVTLNTQFRMHRILGDFVSRQFYESHRESKIQSGTPDEQRSHALQGYTDPTTGAGKVAAWIDVPLPKGAEAPGQSKSRPVEARRIAAELKKLITQKQIDPVTRLPLTFGVITFYSAQVAELNKALKRELRDELRDLAHRPGEPERLLVGTVDAFQGKEFDVVFLSMTRSNTHSGGDELALRRKYGHLMLENRLCVAMSRQKRLLIVAGDAAMLRTPDADRVIGPLVDFYKLCKEQGLVLR